jgi:hypothetical protein
MLGKGAALANLDYKPYEGPLSAGASALQTQAFQGLGSLQLPSSQAMMYNPMSFTGAAYAPPTANQLPTAPGAGPYQLPSGGFTYGGLQDIGTAPQRAAGQQGAYTPASDSVVQQYMTPYLQAALDPQYAAARREAEISAQKLQSQYGKAGAYGGSRQGVAEAELQRGLLDRMDDITNRGYNEAFTQAQNQFNTEQNRQMQAAQQASRLGLDVLGAQRTGGTEQRNIDQAGIAADLAQFEFERDYPQRQVQFMQSLLQGLPLETQAYNYTSTSPLQNIAGGANDIYDILSRLFPSNTNTAATGGTTTSAAGMNVGSGVQAQINAAGG